MRTAFSGKAVNGSSKLGNSATGGGFEAYGDGIKALLADPIQFEPYAKKVTTDEAKYKPINAVETETEGAEGSAGVSSEAVVVQAHVDSPAVRQNVILLRLDPVTRLGNDIQQRIAINWQRPLASTRQGDMAHRTRV